MLSTPWIQSLLLQLGFQEIDPEKPRRKPCMLRSVPILRLALWKLLPNHLARQRISSRLKARDNQGICPWSPEWYIPLLQAWICDRASTRSDDVAESSPHFHLLWSLCCGAIFAMQGLHVLFHHATCICIGNNLELYDHSVLDDTQDEKTQWQYDGKEGWKDGVIWW